METFSALLALSPVTGVFPSQRPVTQSFGVFFDLRLNKWLNKQSRRRWFMMPSLSLWRHCNGRRMTTAFALMCLHSTTANYSRKISLHLPVYYISIVFMFVLLTECTVTFVVAENKGLLTFPVPLRLFSNVMTLHWHNLNVNKMSTLLKLHHTNAGDIVLTFSLGNRCIQTFHWTRLFLHILLL